MNTYIVYKLTNKVNGLIYFGYTKMSNSIDRQKELYRHNKELHCDMITYGLDNFLKEDILHTEDLSEALEFESKCIIENNTLWPNGYNHVVSAKYKTQSKIHKERLIKSRLGEKNGMYGKHHSEKTKIKISEKNSGRQWTNEQKLAQSNRLKGRQFSSEHKTNLSKSLKEAYSNPDLRLLISNKLKGRPKSEETKRKISEKNSGKIRSEETKQKISNSLKGVLRTDEQKLNYSKSASNRIWYTNGKENKTCNKNDTIKIAKLESLGYYRGCTKKLNLD